MKTSILPLLPLFLLLCFSSCKEDEAIISCTDGIRNGEEVGIDCGGTCPECPVDATFRGKVQKGPFQNGSALLISAMEVNDNNALVQTGQVFSSQIADDEGSFSLQTDGVTFDFADLRADGFYFNEVCGSESESQITLMCLSRVGQGLEATNVNVLTHIQRQRIIYLMAEEGLTFEQASTQSRLEVLAIFGLEGSAEVVSFQNLDLLSTVDDQAALLMVSAVLQGYRTQAGFSQLLADISTDLSTDGQLDEQSILDDLYTHASIIDAERTRTNLQDYYDQLGLEVVVPSFQMALDEFLEGADWTVPPSVMEYPSDVQWGSNVLGLDVDIIQSNAEVSLKAILPNDCAELRVRLTSLSDECNDFCWVYSVGDIQNWGISNPNTSDGFSQEFYAQGQANEILMIFGSPGQVLVEYFENGGEEVTRSRTFTVVL